MFVVGNVLCEVVLLCFQSVVIGNEDQLQTFASNHFQFAVSSKSFNNKMETTNLLNTPQQGKFNIFLESQTQLANTSKRTHFYIFIVLFD